MKTLHHSLLRRIALGLLSIVMLLSMSSKVFAFGTVQLKKTTIAEEGGRWKLEMDINYGSKPHMGHIPFDFILTQTTYFEFSQTDQDKEPVVRRKPMVNQTPQRESVDIDFADSKGDLWPRTRFQVGLRRDRGYSAGEYTLEIRRAADGAQMGGLIRLTLDGKNEFIDRRAMVFGGGSSKKPAAAASASAAASSATAPAASADPSKVDPDLAEPPPPETPEVVDPTLPTTENRPHGCGCYLAQTDSSFGAALSLTLVGLGLVLIRRRRA